MMKILVLHNETPLPSELFQQLFVRWANVEFRRAQLCDEPDCASAGAEADLILLDCSQSRPAVFDLLRRLRRQSDVPVIALVSDGDVLQEVRALESGADDCVPTSVTSEALAARVRSVLRRAKLTVPVDAKPNLQFGDLQIRFQDQAVLLSGKRVELTPLEYSLLYQLVTHAGRIMPHQALLERVWGWQHDHDENYVRLFITRLRAKLERPDGPRYIQTIHRRGYRFVPADATYPADALPSSTAAAD
jgi:two-component system KDP operon response regulator KdpE